MSFQQDGFQHDGFQTGLPGTASSLIIAMFSVFPQVADLSINGWIAEPAPKAQGAVPKYISVAPQFPEQRLAQIYRPATAPVVASAVPKYQFVGQQVTAPIQPSIAKASVAGQTPPVIPRIYSGPQRYDVAQPVITLTAVTPPVVSTPLLLPMVQSAPQVADLSISGWISEPAPLAQGAVPQYIKADPQTISNIVAQVWGPAAAPTTTPSPVANYLIAQGQQYQNLQGQIFSPSATPPAVATQLLGAFSQAAPQVADLSISGWIVEPAPLAQGAVPPYQWAAQQPYRHVDASIWKSAVAPAVVVGDVPIRQIVVTQQVYATPQPVIFPSASNRAGDSIGTDYRWGTHAHTIYNAEAQKSKIWGPAAAPAVVSYAAKQFFAAQQFVDRTQQGWIKGTAPGIQGPVPAPIWASPQTNLVQIPAQIWPSVPTPPAILGTTVRPNDPVPGQVDYKVNPSVIWTPSTFSPGNPVVVDTGHGGQPTKKPRKKTKKYSLNPEFLRDKLEIQKEKQFLLDVEQRINELAGIVETKPVTKTQVKKHINAEIGLLSRINALSVAYSVELKSLQDAEVLIEQRKKDLRNEEALAIIFIAANL